MSIATLFPALPALTNWRHLRVLEEMRSLRGLYDYGK
jgi:hypothetical protein